MTPSPPLRFSKVPSAPPRVYLAGAIERAPDGGVGWRRDLAQFIESQLGHAVHDPTSHELDLLTEDEKKGFRQWRNHPATWGRFQEVIRRIIRRDLDLILHHTDYIVALWDDAVMAGGGTHGELTLAFHHSIPVFLVLGVPRERVSSWILGCCEEVFDSMEALKAHLTLLAARGYFVSQPVAGAARTSMTASKKTREATPRNPRTDRYGNFWSLRSIRCGRRARSRCSIFRANSMWRSSRTSRR